MAQEQAPRDPRRRLLYDLQYEAPKEQPPKPSGVLRVAGDTMRAVGERAIPLAALATRLGSGIASTPGFGFGAAVSGAGEALAQMIEQGTMDLSKLNKGRIAVESGVGAIPFSAAIKGGKALASAARGAGISTAGTVARKGIDVVTGTDEDALKKWSPWDVLPTVLGGIGSGVAGKMMPKGTSSPIDDIVDAATAGRPGAPRIAAPKTEATFRVSDPEAPIVSDAKRRASAATPVNPVSDLDTAIEKASTIAAAQRAVNEKGDKAFQKRIVTKEKAAAQGFGILDKESAEAAAARRVDELQGELEQKGISARETFRKKGEDGGTATASISYGKAGEEGGRGAGAVRSQSPRPTSLESKGLRVMDQERARNVIDLDPEDAAKRGVLIKDGEGYRLNPKATATPPTKFSGTPSEVLPKVEAAVSTGAAGAAGAGKRSAILAESQGGADKLEELAKRTGKEIDTPIGAKGTLPAEKPSVPIQGPLSAQQALGKLGYSPEDLSSLTAKEADRIIKAGERKGAATTAGAVAGRSADDQIDDLLKSIYPEDVAAELLPLSQGYSKARATGVKSARLDAQVAMERAIEQLMTAGRLTQQQVDEFARGARAIRRSESPTPPRPPKTSKGSAPPLRGSGSVGAAPIVAGAPTAPTTPKAGAPVAAATKTADDILSELDQTATQISKRKLEVTDDPNIPDAIKQQVLDELDDVRKQLDSKRLDALRKREAQSGGGEAGFMSPELASVLFSRGVPAAAGAMIGGAVSDDDPVGGALLGGIAGGALGKPVLSGLGRIGASPSVASAATGPSILDRINNWQRFSLLSHPYNLGINFAAPTGGAALGSLEQMLAGAASKTGADEWGGKLLGRADVTTDPDAMRLGAEGLKASIHPKRIAKIVEDLDDAKRLIDQAESRADMQFGGGKRNTFDNAMAIPADIMLTGDVGARKGLIGAGWGEDAARKVTVTSNPRYEWLGEPIVNLAKSSPLWRFALPFSRTAANVVEGSLERTPLVGVLMHMAQTNPKMRESASEIIAQQGIGGAVAMGAYWLGATTDPDAARYWKAPTVIANLSGQYGALAAAAFAAGQSSQLGRTTGQQVGAGVASFTRDLPLPTAEPASDIVRTGTSLLDGTVPRPAANSPFERWMPRSLTPRFLRDEFLESQSIPEPVRRLVYDLGQ